MTDNPYTARITSGPSGSGYDVVEFVTGPNEDVENTVRVLHYDGRVIWADKPNELGRLEVAGIRRGCNPAEYFYV